MTDEPECISKLTHLELLALTLEYEHALQHVAELHSDTWEYCFDCHYLAQSALKRTNNWEFLHLAEFLLEG